MLSYKFALLLLRMDLVTHIYVQRLLYYTNINNDIQIAKRNKSFLTFLSQRVLNYPFLHW